MTSKHAIVLIIATTLGFIGLFELLHYVPLPINARCQNLQHTIDSVYRDYQYDSAKIEYLEGQVDLLRECKSRIN